MNVQELADQSNSGLLSICTCLPDGVVHSAKSFAKSSFQNQTRTVSITFAINKESKSVKWAPPSTASLEHPPPGRAAAALPTPRLGRHLSRLFLNFPSRPLPRLSRWVLGAGPARLSAAPPAAPGQRRGRSRAAGAARSRRLCCARRAWCLLCSVMLEPSVTKAVTEGERGLAVSPSCLSKPHCRLQCKSLEWELALWGRYRLRLTCPGLLCAGHKGKE